MNPSDTHSMAHVAAYIMWSLGMVENLTRSFAFFGIGNSGFTEGGPISAPRLASSGDCIFIRCAVPGSSEMT